MDIDGGNIDGGFGSLTIEENVVLKRRCEIKNIGYTSAYNYFV